MSLHSIVQVEDLSKNYKHVTVLNKAFFQLNDGRTAVILGANGMGKTTFVRLISGLSRPSAGKIIVNGRNPGAMPELGVLFEDPLVYPHLSGLHNLSLLAGGFRLPEEEQSYILEVLGLSNDVLRRKAGDYSFGQKRRLTLAAIAFHNPSLWVLDDPTNGLDPNGIKAFVTLLKKQKEKGKSILLTGQGIAAFETLINDLWLLKDKRFTYLGTWETLRNELPGVIKIRPQDLHAAKNILELEGIKPISAEADAITFHGTNSDFERISRIFVNSRLPVYELSYSPPTIEVFYQMVASTPLMDGKGGQ